MVLDFQTMIQTAQNQTHILTIIGIMLSIVAGMIGMQRSLGYALIAIGLVAFIYGGLFMYGIVQNFTEVGIFILIVAFMTIILIINKPVTKIGGVV